MGLGYDLFEFAHVMTVLNYCFVVINIAVEELVINSLLVLAPRFLFV